MKSLVYRQKVNLFLVSLCIADLMVSLSCFYYIATISSENMSRFSKRVATIVFGFALETSVMSLMFLTYERLTAIRNPFRYREVFTKLNVCLMLACGWLSCLSISSGQIIYSYHKPHEHYMKVNWIVFIALAVCSS